MERRSLATLGRAKRLPVQFIAVYTTWRGFQLLATLYQFLAQLDKMAAFTASLAKLAIAALELQGPVSASLYIVLYTPTVQSLRLRLLMHI